MSMNDDIKNILVSEEALKAKVAELGAQISRDYEGRNLVLVSILKGSVVFMADLMRAVTIPCSIDFMVVSSYGGSNTTTSGLVKIIKDLDGDLSGKDVLIVEDILDTGVTLSKLVPMLKMRNPNSVKICTILDKPSRRKADIQPDYEGFQVPDEFVVGYGLDYDEKYRNLPYVGVLKPEIYTKRAPQHHYPHCPHAGWQIPAGSGAAQQHHHAGTPAGRVPPPCQAAPHQKGEHRPYRGHGSGRAAQPPEAGAV